MPIIAIDEHFVTEEVLAAWREVPAEHQDLAVGLSSEPDLHRAISMKPQPCNHA